MCGFVGYLNLSRDYDENILKKMAASIFHRGPDNMGIWFDKNIGLGIAHNRLSIIDVSNNGNQPMQSIDGRYVIAFNGEIYNHKDLREDLIQTNLGNTWRSSSDTETLVSCLQMWGIDETIKKLNGMFAIAIFDREKNFLTLVRDRFGEKPIYYYLKENLFIFGSELKALIKYPYLSNDIDQKSLPLFLRYGYVPSPFTIYKNIFKLEPSFQLTVRLSDCTLLEKNCYWDFKKKATRLINKRTFKNNLDHIDFKERFNTAVKLRMESDVPLGAFLSGGIDSAAVVATMQNLSYKPINTFTIGFDESEYSEAKNAKTISEILGTNHTELIISPDEALKVIPELPNIWDEPFADSSQIPTLLVSRLARKDVTVVLSGDGGDEIFCGYNRYSRGYDFQKISNLLPANIKPFIRKILLKSPEKFLGGLLGYKSLNRKIPHFHNILKKLNNILDLENDQSFYMSLISIIHNPGNLILNTEEHEFLLNNKKLWPKLDNFRETMMILDTLTYLPDDILTKVDRASMSCSLEARTPFLDHKLVEWAWSQPLKSKLNQGQTKWCIKKYLKEYLPMKIINSPKRGFSIPIDLWLKGSLKEWSHDILSAEKLKKEGVFDYKSVNNLLKDAQNIKSSSSRELWNVLMFQAWYDKWN